MLISHLSIVVFDNLQIKEVVLILSVQYGIPAAGFWAVQVFLGAKIIS